MTQFEYHNAANDEAAQKKSFSWTLAQVSAGKATTGVLSGLGVTQTTTASSAVNIAAGAGVVQAATLDGASLLVNDTQLALDILTANPLGGLPRNDIVVFDLATLTPISSGGSAGLRAIIGTPNASPTDPAIPTSAIPLARIRNLASATTIPAAQIDTLQVPTTLNYAPTLNRCQISTTADQTLTASTVTVVDFASSSTAYDVGGMADTANDRITITKAGWYRFSVRAAFAFDATGYRGLLLEKNATTIVADSYGAPSLTSVATVMNLATEPILCAVSDTFRIKVVQAAGGTLPLIAFNGRRVVFTATQQVGA